MNVTKVGLLLFLVGLITGFGLATVFIGGKTGSTDRTIPHAIDPISAKTQNGAAFSPQPDPSIKFNPAPSSPVTTTNISITANPLGNGSISGRVIDGDGKPLEGVLIQATLNSSSTISKQALPHSADEELQELIRSFQIKASNRRNATSTSNGTFRIDGLLEDVKYSLRGLKPGYDIVSDGRGRTSITSISGAIVNFIAHRHRGIPFQVLNPNGKEANPAKIHYRRKGSHFWKSKPWSPQQRMLVLSENGFFQFKATSGKYEDLTSDVQELTLDSNKDIQTIVLTLKNQPGIRGRVIFPQGEAPPALTVHLLRAGDDEPTPNNLNRISFDGKRSLADATNGFRYMFKDVAPGPYWLEASRTSGATEFLKKVVIGESLLTQDIVFPNLATGDFIDVLILDPNGRILRDVSFMLTWKLSSSFHGGGALPLYQPDGSARIVKQRYEKNAMSEIPKEKEIFTLKVSSPLYGQKEVQFSPGTQRLEIRFEEPAILAVSIAGYRGSQFVTKLEVVPVPISEKLQSTHWFPNRGDFGPETLNIHGNQSFGPLEPGEYWVGLFYQIIVGNDHFLLVAKERVTIGSGTTVLSFGLPPLYDVDVITSEGGGKTVSVTPMQGIREVISIYFRNNTDSSGRTQFSQLPAGKYKVELLTKNGIKKKIITVPQVTTVRFLD